VFLSCHETWEGIMTERRYGFRFNIVEAGVLIVSVVLVSVCIFLSGVYVGKGVEAHRAIEQTTALRMPIKIVNESRAPGTNTSLAWKLPKDKPTETEPSDPSAVVGESERPSTNPEAQSLAASARKSSARKSPVTNIVSDERPEQGEEKLRQKSEDWAAAAAKENPRSLKEASSSKAEDHSLVSANDKFHSVKESLPTAREKARTDTSNNREPTGRTAAVQSRPNEKSEEKKISPVTPQKVTNGTKKWKVQVEATSREEVAQDIAKSLRAQGYAPSVSKVRKEGGILYRVRVGRFASQEEAVAAIGRFRRDGKFSQAYPVSE
jgi:cell division septation protein DedD